MNTRVSKELSIWDLKEIQFVAFENRSKFDAPLTRRAYTRTAREDGKPTGCSG